jgi:hypothetical protein
MPGSRKIWHWNAKGIFSKMSFEVSSNVGGEM